MTRRSCVVCMTAALAAAAAKGQVTFVETFENYSNVGGWTYGSPNGFIDPVGGNPGAFFHDPGLSSVAPHPMTTTASVFTGDYRANQVTAVGIDLILFDVEYSATNRALTVMLWSYNGTAYNYTDDWYAYYVGQAIIPQVGEGWVSYDFEIPSQATLLPAGWYIARNGQNAPQDPDWNDVITDVGHLLFCYGDPTVPHILQAWDTGFDNPRITYVPEPAAAGLMLGALAALTFRHR